MKEKIDWKNIGTKELAGLIYQHFKGDGIEVILVGGSCVTIYSNNRYVSADLDYVSYEDHSKIESSLKKLGFLKKGKHFYNSECPFLIDFVTAPVEVGHELVKKFAEMRTKYGMFKLLTPADCVKDRLASFYHWGDMQGLDQAIEVCLDHPVDPKEIRDWSKKEGFEEKFSSFARELKKRKAESGS